MAIHSTIDITAFRTIFAAFSSATVYPDIRITTYYGLAGNYISQKDNFCGGLNGTTLDFALQLLTAHMLYVAHQAQLNKVVGTVTSSSVDSVSVSLLPPKIKDQFQFWLSSTPYGLELLGLLSVKAAGGWVIGGGPEIQSFRKSAGRF